MSGFKGVESMLMAEGEEDVKNKIRIFSHHKAFQGGCVHQFQEIPPGSPEELY